MFIKPKRLEHGMLTGEYTDKVITKAVGTDHYLLVAIEESEYREEGIPRSGSLIIRNLHLAALANIHSKIEEEILTRDGGARLMFELTAEKVKRQLESRKK